MSEPVRLAWIGQTNTDAFETLAIARYRLRYRHLSLPTRDEGGSSTLVSRPLAASNLTSEYTGQVFALKGPASPCCRFPMKHPLLAARVAVRAALTAVGLFIVSRLISKEHRWD